LRRLFFRWLAVLETRRLWRCRKRGDLSRAALNAHWQYEDAVDPGQTLCRIVALGHHVAAHIAKHDRHRRPFWNVRQLERDRRTRNPLSVHDRDAAQARPSIQYLRNGHFLRVDRDASIADLEVQTLRERARRTKTRYGG
jgi:hypothetical protein